MNESERIALERIERMTILAHGDTTWCEELWADPVRACTEARIDTWDRRPGIAIAVAVDEQQCWVPETLRSTTGHASNTPEHGEAIRTALERVGAALRGECALVTDDLEVQVLLVAASPIAGCAEDLARPPGDPGDYRWSLLPMRSGEDRSMCLTEEGMRNAVLAPEARLDEVDAFSVVYQGIHEVRVTGEPTRAILRALSEGDVIGNGIAQRCALARMAARGVAVHKAPARFATRHWRTAGVTPLRAQQIANSGPVAGIGRNTAGERAMRAALNDLQIATDTQAGPNAQAIGWCMDAMGEEEIEKAARAMHAGQRPWLALWTGRHAIAIANGHAGQAPCLACVNAAVRSSEAGCALNGSGRRWTSRERSRLAGALARALSGARRAGTVEAIARTRRAGMNTDQAHPRAGCPVCGRPHETRTRIEGARIGTTGTTAGERPAIPIRVEQATIRAGLDRTGTLCAPWRSIRKYVYDADPLEATLHHVAVERRSAHPHTPNEAHASARTHQDAMLAAIAAATAQDAFERAGEERGESWTRRMSQDRDTTTAITSAPTLEEAIDEARQHAMAKEWLATVLATGTIPAGEEIDALADHRWGEAARRLIVENAHDALIATRPISPDLHVAALVSRDPDPTASLGWGPDAASACARALERHLAQGVMRSRTGEQDSERAKHALNLWMADVGQDQHRIVHTSAGAGSAEIEVVDIADLSADNDLFATALVRTSSPERALRSSLWTDAPLGAGRPLGQGRWQEVSP